MPAHLLPEPDTAALQGLAAAVKARKLPPIDHWHPSQSASSGMRILRDGTWLHEGSPINRPALVQLFSSLLLRDAAGQHWLMTPECRQSVSVEDTAFVALDMRHNGDSLLFRLNTGDWVAAGPDIPLSVREEEDQPCACLQLPHGCTARLNRSTWLQLVDFALNRASEHADTLTVTSNGAVFRLDSQ